MRSDKMSVEADAFPDRSNDNLKEEKKLHSSCIRPDSPVFRASVHAHLLD